MTSNYKVKNGYGKEAVSLNISSSVPFISRTVREPLPAKFESVSVKNTVFNRLLAVQSDREQARLLTQMQSVSLKSGEVIYQQEGDCDFVYLPETAVFSQMNILEDGKTVETAMIGNEGMLGMSSVLDFHPTNYWTQTLIGGTAFKINRQVFLQEFVRGGTLQAAFLEYVNQYIRQISQRAVCNNHHRIENRFSTWLLMLADRSLTTELALTQEQIAAVLGVQRPSVTCIAQSLRSAGIIEYVRGRIILNRQKLEASACECYGVIS